MALGRCRGWTFILREFCKPEWGNAGRNQHDKRFYFHDPFGKSPFDRVQVERTLRNHCWPSSSSVPYSNYGTRIPNYSSSSSVIPLNTRSFRTTSNFEFRATPNFHAAPLPIAAVMAAKQAAKWIAILTARFMRKHYRRLNPEEKARFWSRMRRHRRKFLWFSAVILGLGVGYGMTHLEKTPFTERFRFIALTRSQVKQLGELEKRNQIAEHGPNFLSHDSRIYRNVENICANLIRANSDVPALKELDWKLHVVDRKDLVNAFVLTTGDIFMCTGLLQRLEGDDEIACILGHELAHLVLGHGLEKASRGHILDLIVIALDSLIWLILPSDLISLVTTWISEEFLKLILELPYGRQMEVEADLVGLELTTKACYDVRASSKVWTTMFVMEKLAGSPTADAPIFKYFSTHPLDSERAETLDANIPAALQMRKSCSCPPLPHEDPRIPIRSIQTFLEELEKDELESLREVNLRDVNLLDELITKKHMEKMVAKKEKAAAEATAAAAAAAAAASAAASAVASAEDERKRKLAEASMQEKRETISEEENVNNPKCDSDTASSA